MSNAVANSDASDFGNPEAVGQVRGEDSNNESVNLSFPSVERLVAATIPFSTADGLLHQLCSCWLTTFSLNTCAVIWRIQGSSIVQFASLSDSKELLRTQFPSDAKRQDLAETVVERLPSCRDLQWQTLETSESAVSLIGFDKSIQIDVPASWLATTTKLLETAFAWEQTLTEKKLQALGEYAAGAGHEINNPLAAINGRAAQLLREETDPHRKHLLQTIGAQTYRIRDMIGDSMLFARSPKLQFSKINVAALIENVFSKFTAEFATRGLSLWGNREPDLLLEADETQISIAIAELVRNSLNAVDDGGRIVIDCYSGQVGNHDEIVIRVADNGAGFTKEEREHCFDPFYSGRQAGRGLGFGLSKCWRIVTEHQGRIVLNTIHEEMTEFVITLPAKRLSV